MTALDFAISFGGPLLIFVVGLSCFWAGYGRARHRAFLALRMAIVSGGNIHRGVDEVIKACAEGPWRGMR